MLLHFDGVDGATTTTDSSTGGSGAAVTMHNGAALETDVNKFGLSSLALDGINDSITIARSGGDFDFGSGTFTIDFWIRWATDPQHTQAIYNRYVGNDDYIQLNYHGSSNQFGIIERVSSVNSFNELLTWTPTVNQWHHIALIRGWGGGANTFALTVDGELLGATWTFSGSMASHAADVEIGELLGMDQGSFWMDEFRVSKGVARWTANFTPPSAPYAVNRQNFVVISTLALSGIKAYVKDANPESGPTITGSYWNGSAFSTLALTDGTSGLAQTGSISFVSTVGDAAPRYLEGYFGYCYQFALSAGTAALYRATVNAPFQPITDVWNGVWRTAIQFRHLRSSVFDRTLDVAEMTPAGIDAFADSYTANLHGTLSTEYVDIGFQCRACAIRVWMWDREAGYVNTAAATVTVSYWDGAEFVTCTGVIDGTAASGKTLAKSGVISWNPPQAGSEFIKESYGVKLYYYRLEFSATITGTTGIGVDMVQGVSSPETRLQGFDFPFFFQNRIFLVSDNQAHYCETENGAWWNGDDSSFGAGRRPIKFGGGDPVKAAIKIFNRFGSSLLDYAVVLKQKEIHLLSGTGPDTWGVQQVSGVIGIAAVRTLDSAEVAYKMEETRRNLVVWMAYSGPIIFDAGTPVQARGEIACYFDKNDARCVNYAAIDTSWGVLDPDTNAYHLFIPTGSATVPNTWLVLDLVREKWYRAVPAGSGETYPRAGFRVMDADGAQYVYGLMADGRMMRLSHGATWDGEDMVAFVETGDFVPSGRMRDISKTKSVWLLLEAVSETDAEVTITHYKDGAASGTVANTVTAYHASDKYVIAGKKFEKQGMCHRLRFSSTTDATVGGVPMVGWNLEHEVVRGRGR
ncbi:MAG: LamG domain-containing protein [Desulfosarcina sp.]|nr:LamG domain-containing protein [Desulfosarcina sp.]MBC2741539.1 LamG domain-containing protein [Desulfosarcina sp.]MBC2764453.1 LamG domain-containing protein [Desulfosarcina sp.]